MTTMLVIALADIDMPLCMLADMVAADMEPNATDLLGVSTAAVLVEIRLSTHPTTGAHVDSDTIVPVAPLKAAKAGPKLTVAPHGALGATTQPAPRN